MSETASEKTLGQKGQAQGQSDEDTRMEKVRALLFGSQMRDYDRRFGELGDRLRDEIDRLRQEQNARLAKLEAFLRAELDRMNFQHRQGRQERINAQAELADRIEALERDLRERLEGDGERLSREALALRAEMREQVGEQLEALHRTRVELSEALEKEHLRLQEDKAGREELAQLFTELALRLNREFELPKV